MLAHTGDGGFRNWRRGRLQKSRTVIERRALNHITKSAAAPGSPLAMNPFKHVEHAKNLHGTVFVIVGVPDFPKRHRVGRKQPRRAKRGRARQNAAANLLSPDDSLRDAGTRPFLDQSCVLLYVDFRDPTREPPDDRMG